jgi:DNA-directed RNA polymerase subunit F
MINSLSPEQIAEIKTLFTSYSEVQEEKKQLAAEDKAVKEKVANTIESTSGQAGKLLKLMYKRSEGDNSEDEVSAIYDVITGRV